MEPCRLCPRVRRSPRGAGRAGTTPPGLARYRSTHGVQPGHGKAVSWSTNARDSIAAAIGVGRCAPKIRQGQRSRRTTTRCGCPACGRASSFAPRAGTSQVSHQPRGPNAGPHSRPRPAVWLALARPPPLPFPAGLAAVAPGPPSRALPARLRCCGPGSKAPSPAYPHSTPPAPGATARARATAKAAACGPAIVGPSPGLSRGTLAFGHGFAALERPG